jgi:phosphomannomutase
MKKYIFDVDGTLTPSRSRIDEDFRLWFTDFCVRNDVYLVTGSDYEKTREQLGDYLLRWPIFVYNSSGSDVWAKGERVRSYQWKAPEELISTLEVFLKNSKFHIRTGKHIEYRPGSLNFSIVGRNANSKDRQAYVEWDLATKEREVISKKLNVLYPNIHTSIGGETGLDIFPRGRDKSQILKDFSSGDIIYFFGDRMDELGNDYPLGSKLKDPSIAFHVRDWKHTFELLKEIGD